MLFNKNLSTGIDFYRNLIMEIRLYNLVKRPGCPCLALLYLCIILASGCTTSNKASIERKEAILFTEANPSRIIDANAGESLASIAKKYHVSVIELAEANDIPPDYAFRKKRSIYIPSSESIESYDGKILQRDAMKDVTQSSHVEILNGSLAYDSELQNRSPLMAEQDSQTPHNQPVKSLKMGALERELQSAKGVEITGDPKVIHELGMQDVEAEDKYVTAPPNNASHEKTGVHTQTLSEQELGQPSKTPQTRQKNGSGDKGSQGHGSSFRTDFPLNSEDYMWPLHGKILKRYSKQKHNLSEGISIAAPTGSPVLAASDGEVVHVGQSEQYGKFLIIKHKGGYYTAYAHNSEVKVKRGAIVKKGTIIAKSGQTGDTGSPQLYFSIRKNKVTVDPEALS